MVNRNVYQHRMRMGMEVADSNSRQLSQVGAAASSRTSEKRCTTSFVLFTLHRLISQGQKQHMDMTQALPVQEGFTQCSFVAAAIRTYGLYKKNSAVANAPYAATGGPNALHYEARFLPGDC